jgi:hypothetical protein
MITVPLAGVPQRRRGRDAGFVREPLLHAGTQRQALIDGHSRDEQEGMTKATTIMLQTNALNDTRPVFRTSRRYTG